MKNMWKIRWQKWLVTMLAMLVCALGECAFFVYDNGLLQKSQSTNINRQPTSLSYIFFRDDSWMFIIIFLCLLILFVWRTESTGRDFLYTLPVKRYIVDFQEYIAFASTVLVYIITKVFVMFGFQKSYNAKVSETIVVNKEITRGMNLSYSRTALLYGIFVLLIVSIMFLIMILAKTNITGIITIISIMFFLSDSMAPLIGYDSYDLITDIDALANSSKGTINGCSIMLAGFAVTLLIIYLTAAKKEGASGKLFYFKAADVVVCELWAFSIAYIIIGLADTFLGLYQYEAAELTILIVLFLAASYVFYRFVYGNRNDKEQLEVK